MYTVRHNNRCKWAAHSPWTWKDN